MGFVRSLVVLAGLIGSALAATNIQYKDHPSPRTLVVIDDNMVKTTHSRFFKSFVDRGHIVSFVNVKQEQLVLSAGGQWTTDNVIFFAPNQEDYGGRTRTTTIIDFVKQGGSLLLASSSDLSETQRFIAGSFGVDYDENRSMVVDPKFEPTITQESRAIASTLSPYFSLLPYLAGNAPSHSGLITGLKNSKDRSVLFSGIGLATAPTSRFLKPVLSAPDSAIAPGSQAFLSYGSSISLVVAMQSLTSSRAVFSGSMTLFSDAYAALNPNNAIFADSVGAWVTHDKGFLRTSPYIHQKVGVKGVPIPVPQTKITDFESFQSVPEYRMNDDIHFAVRVEEYDSKSQSWVPVKPPTEENPMSVSKAVMFELILIDPYFRDVMHYVNKEHSAYSKLFKPDDGVFEMSFRAPDYHGIYTLRVSVNQFEKLGEGYSILNTEGTVSVRPILHNEHERFITAGLPYYISTFLVMIAFLTFSSIFLYSK